MKIIPLTTSETSRADSDLPALMHHLAHTHESHLNWKQYCSHKYCRNSWHMQLSETGEFLAHANGMDAALTWKPARCAQWPRVKRGSSVARALALACELCWEPSIAAHPPSRDEHQGKLPDILLSKYRKWFLSIYFLEARLKAPKNRHNWSQSN